MVIKVELKKNTTGIKMLKTIKVNLGGKKEI